ncbi:hypothetical protein IU438_03920 [Nocardia cyriacigeorgica]|uniref:hypothetical protein n=1 Tax=Nocardia cyriacigeorgica TaxID=135487 RepID=UPI0018942D06|nr:hypothetical protein [Nocardia cyriacigeorgica]MBF6316284.1 hypothetical protein [Nocardia cyriacigeorgica]MBF6394931.1 hypothetical protein [Nocardia cyriacigeorgica]MBF6400564.1 hypothetical protein [Nocardia cyriacigeorgica]MBF6531069.1 hypothetical protein [Nocardia cyriacigeorgica]
MRALRSRVPGVYVVAFGFPAERGEVPSIDVLARIATGLRELDSGASASHDEFFSGASFDELPGAGE